MDLDLGGKTAVVVGGSSNLGRAITLGFAAENANVVVAARHLDDCERVAEAGSSLGSGRLMPCAVDATSYEQVEDLVTRTLGEFGRIDIFVGSIGWNGPGDFLKVDRAAWDRVIATNYTYQLNCFHCILPQMIRQRGGVIITVSSVMGRRASPMEPIYSGAKAAEIVFSHAMAREMGQYGIRINVVAPGPTLPADPDVLGGESWYKHYFAPPPGQTPDALVRQQQVFDDSIAAVTSTPQMRYLLSETPLGRFGTAEGVAKATLFLASDSAAGNLTGQVLGVDGGLYMPH